MIESCLLHSFYYVDAEKGKGCADCARGSFGECYAQRAHFLRVLEDRAVVVELVVFFCKVVGVVCYQGRRIAASCFGLAIGLILFLITALINMAGKIMIKRARIS